MILTEWRKLHEFLVLVPCRHEIFSVNLLEPEPLPPPPPQKKKKKWIDWLKYNHVKKINAKYVIVASM